MARRPRPLPDRLYGRLTALTLAPATLKSPSRPSWRAKTIPELLRYFPGIDAGALQTAADDLVAAHKAHVILRPCRTQQRMAPAYYIVR